MAFVLVAFTVSFFAHGSPLFNYLFWIPFEAIRRLVDAESPLVDGATGSEGPERGALGPT
jgi:hypothetical protein